jgi:hypothetical protein
VANDCIIKGEAASEAGYSVKAEFNRSFSSVVGDQNEHRTGWLDESLVTDPMLGFGRRLERGLRASREKEGNFNENFALLLNTENTDESQEQ